MLISQCPPVGLGRSTRTILKQHCCYLSVAKKVTLHLATVSILWADEVKVFSASTFLNGRRVCKKLAAPELQTPTLVKNETLRLYELVGQNMFCPSVSVSSDSQHQFSMTSSCYGAF